LKLQAIEKTELFFTLLDKISNVILESEGDSREIEASNMLRKRQKIFRKIQGFIKIINLVTGSPQNLPELPKLCIRNYSYHLKIYSHAFQGVLKVITSLLLHNPKNKRHFKMKIGYDQLSETITYAFPKGLDFAVFQSLFSMVNLFYFFFFLICNRWLMIWRNLILLRRGKMSL